LHYKTDARWEATRRKWPLDPLSKGGGRRAFLLSAARLVDLANHTDRSSRRSKTSHPTATLLRGSARAIRCFLCSRQALAEDPPVEMLELIQLTSAVVAGPRTKEQYDRLDRLAGGFSKDGKPDPELRPPTRSRL